MGLEGISIWQLLIVLLVVVLVFGTKKLSNVGSDIGGAIKIFKRAMNESDDRASHEGAPCEEPPRKVASEGAEFTAREEQSKKTEHNN
jgi:sec-independent protein translocase protein TatA